MQTVLRLFQIPEIDTSILSGIGEFHDNIERFEQRWNIKLEFSPNARWRPGSYERLKGQVVKSLFPNWEKPRGANTIRKLTRYDSYTIGNLQKELITIDDELRGFRNNKIYLEGGKAAEEGKGLLDELMANYSKVVSDVYVDITPIPYWNRSRRRLSSIEQLEYVPPIIPKIVTSDGELPNPMQGFAQSTKNVRERITQASQSKNPKRWYINIIVSLRDIELNYFKASDETNLLAEIPWGNLYVGFTMPIYDLVMNYRKLVNRVNLNNIPLNVQRFANQTYKFPFIPGIQHPFVHRGSNSVTNSYEWGNTCFGSWKHDVTLALCNGNLAHLKAILILWAKTYHCTNTSPLNQPENCHLGQDVNWVKGISNYLRTSPATCRTAVQAGYTTVDLLEGHCSICALKEMGECTYYEELTYVPYELPEEFLTLLNDKLREASTGGNSWIPELTVIKRLVQKMWSMKTRVTDAQFNSWFYIQDYGTGFMAYENLLAELCSFNGWKDQHYKDEVAVDWDEITNIVIGLYNYAERVYWTQSVRTHHAEAYDRLADNHYFEWLDDAQNRLPLDELQSMVHTYRLQNGTAGMEPAYSTYLIDIYQLNQAMENNQQSFDDAVEEVQRLDNTPHSTVETSPDFYDAENTEGPF